MTLRRLPAALPFAVLVAVLAHFAGVGFEHAPGGANSTAFLAALALALGFVVLVAFVAGAVRTSRIAIATARIDGYGPLWLAAVGFAAYVAIELVEGHLAFGSALRAFAAVVPAALAVAWAARSVTGAASRAGSRFAGFARVRGSRAAVRYARRSATGRQCVPRVRGRNASCGRAPPLLA